MAWISFGALPCRKTWWQLASRCCWNRARLWHDSKLVSFLVGLRTCQHPGTWISCFCINKTELEGKQMWTLKKLNVMRYVLIYVKGTLPRRKNLRRPVRFSPTHCSYRHCICASCPLCSLCRGMNVSQKLSAIEYHSTDLTPRLILISLTLRPYYFQR